MKPIFKILIWTAVGAGVAYTGWKGYQWWMSKDVPPPKPPDKAPAPIKPPTTKGIITGPTGGAQTASFANAAAGSYCCKGENCQTWGSKCKCYDTRTGGFTYSPASICQPASSME